jgi:RNA polymerase sigma-70 factor (ECF subfamily)
MQNLTTDRESSPSASLERVEAMRVVDGLLATLDEDKREVFVLAEIEQMTAVEIAEIVEANPNTVASRLRAARRDFEKALARFRARESGRQP